MQEMVMPFWISNIVETNFLEVRWNTGTTMIPPLAHNELRKGYNNLSSTGRRRRWSMRMELVDQRNACIAQYNSPRVDYYQLYQY